MVGDRGRRSCRVRVLNYTCASARLRGAAGVIIGRIPLPRDLRPMPPNPSDAPHRPFRDHARVRAVDPLGGAVHPRLSRQDVRHRVRRRGRRRRHVSRHHPRPQSAAQPRHPARRRARIAPADRGDPRAAETSRATTRTACASPTPRRWTACSKPPARCAAASRRCCRSASPTRRWPARASASSSGNFITAKPIGVRRRRRHAADRRGAPHRHGGDPAAPRRRRHRADLAARLFAHRRDLQPARWRRSRPRSPCASTAHKLIFLMETEGVRNGRRQLLTELSTTRCRGAARQAPRKLPADVQHYLPVRGPRLRQRRQARAPHQPPPRRRAAARALHARRRRHDDRGGAARAPAQRDDRRRRRHPADHRAAGGAGHAGAPLARAAGDGDRALRRRRARRRDHRLRGALCVSRGEGSASSPRWPCIRISAARATARR